MSHSQSQNQSANTRSHRADAHPHPSHRPRIAAAQADMAAIDALDLSRASRTEMALALERMRGSYAELIRMELEHHPEG